MEEKNSANRIKAPKKKSSAGVIIPALIDVFLLAVIIVSLVRKPEQGDSQNIVAASETQNNEILSETQNNENDTAQAGDASDDVEFHDYRYEDTQLSEEDTENIDNNDINEDSGFEDITSDANGLTASDFSTTERPKLSDFMWYFDGAYYNGIPSDIEIIEDPELLSGDWKGFIWYDPERQRDSYGLEFLNVNLDIDKSKVKVVFDLYQLSFENTEIINEEDQENLVFNGQWDNGRCDATGPGNVHIDTFYSHGDGKQYAVGTIDSPDGTPTYFAMVRP